MEENIEIDEKEIDEAVKTSDNDLTIEDATEISKKAMNHILQTQPLLPFLHFRVHSIKKNDQPDFWVVICSFDERFGSDKRVRYEIHLNKQGVVTEEKEI